MHQLIIIGNGFDRACGLNSDFGSFFSSRHDAGGVFLPSSGMETAWDIILASIAHEDPLWCDVEAVVTKWVIGEEGSAPVVDAFGPYLSLPSGDISTWRETELNTVREYALYSFGDPLYSPESFTREDISRRRALHFLLTELHLFECEFAAYLCDQVAGSVVYSARAARMLERLALDSLDSLVSTSVLDFNYTSVNLSRLPDAAAHNVHGSLEMGDIVIGVDGKEVADGSPALPFTKTYRLLALDPIEYRSLFRPAGSADQTRLIKFYGHSLAAADYSYFQSIFDAVDLYGSDVTLGFYYSGYNDSSGREIPDDDLREVQYERVSHLLATYGETFDNDAHGHNLMHKLLLEGRLFIRRL